MNTSLKILDHLLVVNLEVRIWSARKKLSAQDLGGAELPPEDLASLGSKRICDPEALQTFGTLKSRAVSLLDKHGIRFLSGWAIPEDQAQLLNDELSDIRADFNLNRHIFLQTYDQAVQDWIAKHPNWSSIIANSVVSRDYVSSRLSFNWHMFKVAPAAGKVGESLKDEAFSLGNVLFDDIARIARDAWQRCFLGRTEITRKALSPLKALQQKMYGLSFLEPRVAPTVELVDAALNRIPKRGEISGDLLLMLQGLLCLMQNPPVLLEHGQMILEGNQNVQQILSGFMQKQDDLKNISSEQECISALSSNYAANQRSIIESHGLW